MLKPEPMVRTLIVSSKGHQPAVIEALHAAGAAHFVDFQEPRQGEFADFRIGSPLPHGAPASERLVRIRALLRHLGVEGAEAERGVPARDLDQRLDATLDQVEGWVQRAVETRESVRAQLATGQEMEAKLDPLRALPLRLEDYRGYDTLAPFVGRADPEFEAELPRVAPDHLLVKGEGTLFALFVPAAQAAAATDLLYRHGYSEVEVPEGKGTPEERVRELRAERATLEQRLEKADAELARLAQEHKDFLLSAEEHLAIAVEKAEAPLAFASSENAFVVDAWIPASRVDDVESVLKRATGDNVYVARLETADGHDHDHHEDHDSGIDQPFAAHPEAAIPHAMPPTKYDNPGGVQSFQWFTNLFSVPRYNEIDPTVAFAFFFPLFFGFMVGDLGLGIAMVLLGWLMMAKLPRVDGMKQLGTAFILAGIVAAILGGFVFKDALGIPLGVTHHMEEAYFEPAGIAVPTCEQVYKLAHEPTWGCMLGMGPVHAEPIVGKVADVPSMLLLSILAAGVHLLLGLAFGIRNEWGHGGKHLAAKFGYLVLLLTFFPAVIALLRPDMLAGYAGEAGHAAVTLHLPLTAGQAYMAAGVGFLVGAVVLGWAEGFGGILEIPSMFTHIMSYLRLGAVAIAKGAMAVAFNSFTLVPALIAGGIGVAVVLGFLGFVIAQVVLLALGLLSGGIQSLRLNFVEMYTKFYKGGGTPYRPFGRQRRLTATHSPAGTPAVAAVLLTDP